MKFNLKKLRRQAEHKFKTKVTFQGNGLSHKIPVYSVSPKPLAGYLRKFCHMFISLRQLEESTILGMPKLHNFV